MRLAAYGALACLRPPCITEVEIHEGRAWNICMQLNSSMISQCIPRVRIVKNELGVMTTTGG